MIKSHGQRQRYFHEILGYNYSVTDIAATIGLCQLGKLEEFNNKRIRNAEFLSRRLNGIRGLVTPHVRPNVKHVFHLYRSLGYNGHLLNSEKAAERVCR